MCHTGLKQRKKVHSFGVEYLNEVHENKHTGTIPLNKHVVSNVTVDLFNCSKKVNGV